MRFYLATLSKYFVLLPVKEVTDVRALRKQEIVMKIRNTC